MCFGFGSYIYTDTQRIEKRDWKVFIFKAESDEQKKKKKNYEDYIKPSCIDIQ